MIVVHHLENSRSQRVLWLLEELGLNYEIRHYKRDAKTSLAPPELRRVHPLGKSPVISDGDRVMAETGAIVDYLLAVHGNGRMRPDHGTDAYWRYVYWLHFAEGTLMPPLVTRLLLGAAQQRAPFLLRPVAGLIGSALNTGYLGPLIESCFDMMEAELAGRPFFLGDALTGADIMLSFPIEAAVQRGGLGNRANLTTWLARIKGRPAYVTALQKGGPYAYA